jgi:hypothetical protein
LTETNPDFGDASAPVEVQRYTDGSVHVVVEAAVVELVSVVTEVEIFVEVDSVVAEVEVIELTEVPPLPVHGRHWE